jgi:hypothetical protein
MANLFFPQLLTGALIQYPVKRTKIVHTAGIQAEDGSVISYLDPNLSTLSWGLTYADINGTEVSMLQALFDNCRGRFRPFTFLDPLANLLTSEWQVGPTIQIAGSTYINAGNAPQEIYQKLAIPAAYVYSFSVAGNAGADPSAKLALIRRGTTAEQRTSLPLNQSLLVSSGALPDPGTIFTVALELQPGQAIDLGQAQLEAQPAPSAFRPTLGGVYPNAHWAVDELLFTATGPDTFSTRFIIETHV